MHTVGTIVAYFFAELSPHFCPWLLQASELDYALCIQSGLSLPTFALLPGYPGLEPIPCIMHKVGAIVAKNMPKVGIIVAQSRDYRCPHFFYHAFILAYYKGFRVFCRVMHA